MDPQVVRYSERPELWDATGDLFDGVWPEYNQHGKELGYYWRQLGDVFPEWQFVLIDPADQTILAECNTIPVAWDGTDEDLGPGIDATLAAAFRLRAAGGRPTAVSALAAKVPPRHQGRGLAPVTLRAMAALTGQAGMAHLVAPVRPSRKDRYPITPIERYARWTRADGLPFDPWVRVHVRMGARIGPAIPRSLHIAGTVADWESWTDMRFPETGRLRVPGGPGHRAHRSRAGHRKVLGTEHLAHPPGQPTSWALDHSKKLLRPGKPGRRAVPQGRWDVPSRPPLALTRAT